MEKQPGSKNASRHGHQHNFSPTLELETAAQGRGFQQVAGVDEAGRGPLAGPVMVAAVILGKDWNAEHPLNDSKKLSSTKREQLFDVICSEALAFKIVSISAEEIDRLNILQATLHGMLRCLTEIEPAPDYALVDGNRFPQTTILGEAVVKGDARSKSIAAASILAKVTRDRVWSKMQNVTRNGALKVTKAIRQNDIGQPLRNMDCHPYIDDLSGSNPCQSWTDRLLLN